MMKNFSSSAPKCNNHTFNHQRQQNNRIHDLLPLIRLRCTLRSYAVCLATLIFFCLASLSYQLYGGPPRILVDIRQYLGQSTYLEEHKSLPPRIDLMRNISNIPPPFLYERHVHFLNFSRVRLEEPVYINIIRDPISRFLSNYFFRRFGDWKGEQNHFVRTPGMKDDERYLDINVCILENYPECSNPRVFYIIPYFCGQHPQCREPGVWALEKAKQHVMENYLLVGILEELEDVFLMLERLLPHYFTGVLSIYKSNDFKKMGNMTGTVRKHTPTLEALQVLYNRMHFEYEFYNFVRDQFHLLKKKIGLKSVSQPPAYSPAFLRELAVRTPEPLDDDEELDANLEDAKSWLVHP
ncbi:uronyl 2-sulfotransferase a isoform X2 [Antennarius striatus]|uniref:uronyl 2-sulfotransferase a isoform X2 n=1 Tax=Antennarius striatus TaxID=241820 RepID=UPI0035B301CA